MKTTAKTFYLEYPPFSRDFVKILTSDEYWQELPPNHHYERVTVAEQAGEPADYPSYASLKQFVSSENASRSA